MQKPMKPRSAVLALVAATVFYASAVPHGRAQAEAPVLAVAEIQYVDTSGEVMDQSADHFRRWRHAESFIVRQILDHAEQ
jgi:hypothetical protein